MWPTAANYWAMLGMNNNLLFVILSLKYFFRYATRTCVKSEFFMCEPLLATTKAVDVYNLVDDFCKKNGLNWTQRIGWLTTDGAPAMLGKRSGFGALIKKEAPSLVVVHCHLHRHALAAQTLPSRLLEALNFAVKAVNFIRAQALNHRLFKILCQELGSEHDVLLYHTDVRWLSRGRVLTRVMELRNEIATFLREKKNKLVDHFDEPSFIISLAYLADIFSHLNDLNVSLQGTQVTILDAREKISSFQSKLELWIRRVKKDNYSNFPTLETLVKENEGADTPEWIGEDIADHLENLVQEFQG